MTTVLDEHVEFFKGILVEQERDPLPRRQFSLGVLRRNALLSAASPRLSTTTFQLIENVLHPPDSNRSDHRPLRPVTT
jgi:hypothetical protein